MSTTPTELLPTEPELDFGSIKDLMDAFDPAALLPDLEEIFGSLATVCRWAVIVGPVILLVLGLAYLFLAPREANHYFGYRCYFGMGSVGAWRFTQRLAGVVLSVLGLVLTVVMVNLSGKFAAMDVMDMAWQTVECLVWQAGLALLATLGINLTALVLFTAKGEPRLKQKRK